MKLVKKFLRSFSQDFSDSKDTKKFKVGHDGIQDIPYQIIGVPAGTPLLDLKWEDYEKLRVSALQQLPNILKKALRMDKSTIQKVMTQLKDVENQAQPAGDFSIFGYPLHLLPSELVNHESQLPLIIIKLMKAFVYGGGFEREGPFRTEGDKQVLLELVQSISQGFESEGVQVESFPVPVLAAAIKRYLRQIPGCLIPAQQAQLLAKAATLQDDALQQAMKQLLIFSLPFRNAKILSSILLLLQGCAVHESVHKMSSQALAVCFGPTVFDTGIDLQLITTLNSLLAEFISERATLMTVPDCIVEREIK